jgi:hypothetical protein
MDEAAWTEASKSLEKAAESVLILARCLAVGPQLDDWRRTGDEVRGGDAANALDQARGMLERLMGGEAEALVARLDALLGELPPAWD